MCTHPVDREAIRALDAQFAAVLAQYPALREPNPEREAALAEWLQTLNTDTEEPQP